MVAFVLPTDHFFSKHHTMISTNLPEVNVGQGTLKKTDHNSSVGHVPESH